MSVPLIEEERAETPQDFIYKTKIVVLNYLGIGPPDFDIQSADSFSDTCSQSSGNLSPAEEEELASAEPPVAIKVTADSTSACEAVTQLKEAQNVQIDVKQSLKDAESSSSDTKLTTLQVGRQRSKSKSPVANRRPGFKAVPKICLENDLYKSRSPFKRRSMVELHEQYQHTLREMMTKIEKSKEEKSSPESVQEKMKLHELYQKAFSELVQLMQKEEEKNFSPHITPEISQHAEFKMHDEFQHAMTELRLKIKQEQNHQGGSLDQFCPISREALVAERIAQIGDRIMESHGQELERALRTALSSSSGQFTYSLFKAVLRETIKTHAPGWYHLAVAMNFTRHLAFGLLSSGNKGFEVVTDYAVRYIEENLARSILDQGGWDAITCINLDDLDEDVLSEISSGNATPYSIDSISLGSTSPIPTPPYSRANGASQTDPVSESFGQRRGLILNIPVPHGPSNSHSNNLGLQASNDLSESGISGDKDSLPSQADTSFTEKSINDITSRDISEGGVSSEEVQDSGDKETVKESVSETDGKRVEADGGATEARSSPGWLETATVAAVAVGVTAGVMAIMKRL